MERVKQEDCSKFEASMGCTFEFEVSLIRERLLSKSTNGSQAWWPSPIDTALRRQSQEELGATANCSLGASLIYASSSWLARATWLDLHSNKQTNKNKGY